MIGDIIFSVVIFLFVSLFLALALAGSGGTGYGVQPKSPPKPYPPRDIPPMVKKQPEQRLHNGEIEW